MMFPRVAASVSLSTRGKASQAGHSSVRSVELAEPLRRTGRRTTRAVGALGGLGAGEEGAWAGSEATAAAGGAASAEGEPWKGPHSSASDADGSGRNGSLSCG